MSTAEARMSKPDRFLYAMGVWAAGILVFWSCDLAITLIIETAAHLHAGITLTPHHGTRNFVPILLGCIFTFLWGVASGAISEFRAKQ